MGTNPNSESDADSPDTDACIDTEPPAGDQPTESANTLTPALVSNTTNHGWSRFFDSESNGTGDALGEFVTDVMTVAQSQYEHATDYADL